MSIQLNTKYRIQEIVKSWSGVARQFWERARHGGAPKVYFRYKNYRTHPGFASYYDRPPVPWSNWCSADLQHWINYPKIIDCRPFLVESNDHPLSAVAWKKRVSEPAGVLGLIAAAQNVYEHKNCKVIIIPCDGFKNLFTYYFSEAVCKKLIKIPTAVCNPHEIDWIARSQMPVAFCCLASDYSLKGVDLVLRAWLSTEKRNKSKLILACPNIPPDIRQKILGEKSINLIEKAPLSLAEKDAIFRGSHISLAPTHVHGGTNVNEGLEYGHTPIMFEYHLKMFQDFGSTIPVPYYFYTPNGYGKRWKTFQEFFFHLSADKKAGVFDSVVEALIQKISTMIDNPEIVINAAKKDFLLSTNRFSVDTRNKKLLHIYSEILKS
jgi:glycosyltransferase involved in cell wall biosynthesis